MPLSRVKLAGIVYRGWFQVSAFARVKRCSICTRARSLQRPTADSSTTPGTPVKAKNPPSVSRFHRLLQQLDAFQLPKLTPEKRKHAIGRTLLLFALFLWLIYVALVCEEYRQSPVIRVVEVRPSDFVFDNYVTVTGTGALETLVPAFVHAAPGDSLCSDEPAPSVDYGLRICLDLDLVHNTFNTAFQCYPYYVSPGISMGASVAFAVSSEADVANSSMLVRFLKHRV